MISAKVSNNDLKKQLPINLISNVGYFVLKVMIGIWMVPYLIRNLGIEGYSFVPLAVSVTAYVSLITVALNSAVSRYLVIALQKNDSSEANKIFNTAFWSIAILSTVLVPLSCIISWLSPKIFNIPKNLTGNVQLFFFIVLLSFTVSIFSSTFSASTFAQNRLDLRNVIDIGNIIVRTLLIILFFVFISPNLINVGISYFFGALMALMLGYFFFRQLTPSLKISRHHFNYLNLKKLTSMGGWLVVNQIGTVLFLQIDLIVVNIFLGASEAGKYAAILQWNFLLRSLAGVASSVLSPMVVISYVNDEAQKIVSMSQRAIRFMGLGIAIPVGLLCGFSMPLLTVWLGKDFTQLGTLLSILTFHLAINLAVSPLFAINNALNRVKIPGIMSVLLGFVNLFLAIFLVKPCSLGLYGVAIAGATTLTLKNALFSTIYAAHILEIPYKTFIRPLGSGILLAGITFAIGLVINQHIVIKEWIKLLLIGGLTFLCASIIGFWLLNKNDRVYLWSLFISRERMK